MRVFVDAHLHAWDRTAMRYPWLDLDQDAPLRFEPANIAAVEAPSAAVFVEAAAHPSDALNEARWATSLSGLIQAVVAFAPVEVGDSVSAHLEDLQRIKLVTGVRQVLQDKPDEVIQNEAVAAGVREVGAHGLTFDACVRDRQLPALLHLVRAAPDTTIVLDHLGKPPVRAGWGDPRTSAWRSAIHALASEPNVLVKLSGMPPESGPGPLDPQVRPFVETAMEAFGARRAMAGSDWPVSCLSDRQEHYSDWFEFLASGLGLSGEESAQLLYSTAARTYRIPGLGPQQ